MRATGTLWRRLNSVPVQIHDAINAANQKGLHGQVVLGDDNSAVGLRGNGLQANGPSQINNRDGLSA